MSRARPSIWRKRRPGGFTLVEVLVALAIMSIALLAALRAAAQGTGAVSELRLRLLAGWVAENRLAEHRARGVGLPAGIAPRRKKPWGPLAPQEHEVVSP